MLVFWVFREKWSMRMAPTVFSYFEKVTFIVPSVKPDGRRSGLVTPRGWRWSTRWLRHLSRGEGDVRLLDDVAATTAAVRRRRFYCVPDVITNVAPTTQGTMVPRACTTDNAVGTVEPVPSLKRTNVAGKLRSSQMRGRLEEETVHVCAIPHTLDRVEHM